MENRSVVARNWEWARGRLQMGSTRQFLGQCNSSTWYCDGGYMTLPQPIALYINLYGIKLNGIEGDGEERS